MNSPIAIGHRFLVAGYGMPAEFAITALFGLGAMPSNVAVLTHPEDERNRGLHAIAQLRGLTLCDAAAKMPETERWVREFAPDILVSVHFRSLIPEAILALAPLGGVNLHPSLLPDYRGTNSVAWAIINGEQETGFTFHRMDTRFDTGATLMQRRIAIRPEETAFSLFHRQIVRAMACLEQVITLMVQGAPGSVQPAGGSYFPRALPYGGRIDPHWPRDRIERFIRAMVFPPFQPALLEAGDALHEVADWQTYRVLAERFELPLVPR